MSKSRQFFLSSLMLGIASSSFAINTTNANLSVFASVTSQCAVSTTSLNFGAYNPSSGNNSTAVITATCTGASVSSVNFAAGPGGSGSITNRSLASTTAGSKNTLSYNLYTDAAFTNVFGDGVTGGSQTISSKPGAAVTVYGKLPSGQTISQNW